MKRLPIVAILILLLCCHPNFGQAPNLGTAASFILFTTTGAVSNTGISHITGNVGTNGGGAISSFSNIDGGMHNADGLTANCSSDLLVAYNELNTTAATFFPTPVLGNGSTLTAGVYSIAGAGSLVNTLSLDAQGNPNAVFIFKVQGAFSAAAGSEVILTNGAKACNVFWKAEGLISLAAGTIMRGTLIANNAAISLGADVILEGRALSTTGAVSVYGLIAHTPIGCGTPILTGPVAPTLASTSCYALFSSNGAVSNAGLTSVIGDIGTNLNTTTGYNQTLVSGIVHPVPDASTATSATDLQTVYSYLNGLPNDIELLYPAQFGNGLTLTAHTYIMNAAAILTDTLFLNADGNANAVFVIKVNGALSTSANAKVILTNGAQGDHVFWKVEGAVTINDHSDFVGTIISNNGAIVLNTATVLQGRAFTTHGTVNTVAITATASPSGCSTFVLPVSWLYFRGKPAGQKVLLEWSTVSEINSAFFSIEKSPDAIHFTPLIKIFAPPGIGKNTALYTTVDQQPYDQGYYRISQTDKNGQSSFYRTIEVNMNSNQNFRVFSFLQQNDIAIQASGSAAGNGFIELYSIDGRKLASRKILLTRETNTYLISRPSLAGVYLIVIYSQAEKLYDGKIAVL
jgi:hypothetical protein